MFSGNFFFFLILSGWTLMVPKTPPIGSIVRPFGSELFSFNPQATVGDRRTRVWSMALKSVVSNLVSDLAGQHSHDHHAFGQVASSFTAFFPDVAPHHDQFLPSIAPETVHQGDAVHLDQFNESLMATRRPKMPVSFHKEEEEKKDGWCEFFAQQAASKRGYERRESWNVALEICPGSKLSKLQQFPLGTEIGPWQQGRSLTLVALRGSHKCTLGSTMKYVLLRHWYAMICI